MYYHKKLLFLFFIVFLAGFPILNSEAQTIALHPIHAEDREVADICLDVLINELHKHPGFTIYPIDLNNLPPDVPSGGFPAHICPSPSVTMGAPYAITGEVFYDPDFIGNFRLRLYVWEMEWQRLLVRDELTAPDRAYAEIQMQYLVPWLLAWIGIQYIEPAAPAEQRVERVTEYVYVERPETESAMEPGELVIQETEVWDPDRWHYIGSRRTAEESTPSNDPNNWVYLGPETEKWLYLGVRGGGGSSQWYNDQNQAYGFPNQDITGLWAVNLSLQVSLHILRYFDIQTEANFSADIGSLAEITTGAVKSDGVFVNWSLTIPVLLKLNMRGSHLKAGIFAGAYYYLPLGQTGTDKIGNYFDYKPAIPGFTFGLNIGWKVGPGYLFFDGRFEYDGRWFTKERDIFYYRNLTKFNAGYEIGFIGKKPK